MTRTALVASLFLLMQQGARSQRADQRDGQIIREEPCAFGPYEDQSAFTRQFYSRTDYEAARNNPRTACSRITYVSAGLKVIGFLIRPRGTGARPLPVIIFNRGGFGDIGKIQPFNLVDLTSVAEQGFVILASQYRGNDGGEGHEELGDADLEDVANLLETAKSLPYADVRNVFMYGVSRGGMMTFLSMKRGIPMRAAAVVGAVYDLAAFAARSPGVVSQAARLIPGYEQKGMAALQERSVINWPQAVSAPLLILHGTADEEVPVTEALAFATKFSALQKPFALVVYSGDVHEVALNRQDRDAQVIAWFRRFLR